MDQCDPCGNGPLPERETVPDGWKHTVVSGRIKGRPVRLDVYKGARVVYCRRRTKISQQTAAMKTKTDWEGRYQVGDMPWEKGEASPGLVDFLAANRKLLRGTVGVPGCGTGHDVRAWAKAGFSAVGFDVAPSAVKLAKEKTDAAGLKAEFRQRG